MRLREAVTKTQLRWGDVAWGPVDGRWPGIAFARGTSAWSQLKKIDIDVGEVVISVCVGDQADPVFKRRITGFSRPDYFTAPSREIAEPAYFLEAEQKYGRDRWPDSIACRAIFRFVDPPSIDQLVAIPRLVTGTRGRYLSDLRSASSDLYEKIESLEIEELRLYRSQQYLQLAQQPRKSAYRQAGQPLATSKDVQSVLYRKVQSIFAMEAASGRVYEYRQRERRVIMDETTLFLLLCELWEAQVGRCDYCQVPLTADGLDQVSVDRLENDNREYGRHNIHLTCLECNRGRGTASHDEMLDLWDKRRSIVRDTT